MAIGARLTPTFAAAIVLAASLLVLGTALASQYWGGLVPCPLCLTQRIPYWVTIGLSAAAAAGSWALAGTAMTRLCQGLLVLCAVAFAAGAGVAVYHVGVEQHWWSAGACTSQLGEFKTVEELRAALLRTPVARCDETAWSLFGISMAGYNAIVSAGLTAGSLFLVVSMAPQRETV
jgi:disulfide bond formation protein DsbB